MRAWSLHTSSYSCSTYKAEEQKHAFHDVEQKVRANAEKLSKLEYYGERFSQHKLGIEYRLYLKQLLTIVLKRASPVVLYSIMHRAITHQQHLARLA
jgi:hypothetical protein